MRRAARCSRPPPTPGGWVWGALAGGSPPSPVPFLPRTQHRQGANMEKRRRTLNLFLLSNKNQAVSRNKNTPAALPSSQTPGCQELPRASRLPTKWTCTVCGQTWRLATVRPGRHCQAEGSWPGPVPAWCPLLSQLWEQAQGLCRQMTMVSSELWPGLQGVSLPMGG